MKEVTLAKNRKRKNGKEYSTKSPTRHSLEFAELCG